MTTPPEKKKRIIPTIPWHYFTRALGTVIFLYGVFGDKTPERGTIILTGAGIAGLDRVARSDEKEQNDEKGK